VAQVLAYVPDLLFGSNVLGALRAAGHEAVLVNELSPEGVSAAEVLVVDLTAEADERIEQFQATRRAELPAIAFYSHVETEIRAAAEAAGFDLVVPRSRMAREGAALVSRLAAGQ
jgi:hypothetical protein